MIERSNGLTKQGISEFREVILDRRRDANKKFSEWAWLFKFSGAGSYSGTFLDLLNISLNDGKAPPHSLKELVRKQRKLVGVPLVLDLMGYGAVLTDLNVHGCAVALTDERTTGRKKLDQALDKGFIAGDVRAPQTWKKLRVWQESQNRKFNLILCRPFGGMSSIHPNETYYKYVFNQLYSLLSIEGGNLLTSYHAEMRSFVFSMVQRLNDMPGLYAVVTRQNFMLVKNRPAPKNLV